MVTRAWAAATLAILIVLTGCATVHDPPPLPTGTLWGYTTSEQAGTQKLVITYERVECNIVRAKYAREARAAMYLPNCQQLSVAPGGDYWIVPATRMDGYVGANTREECEALERQSRDSAEPARTCQGVRVEFR